jgi:hypothetical protein
VYVSKHMFTFNYPFKWKVRLPENMLINVIEQILFFFGTIDKVCLTIWAAKKTVLVGPAPWSDILAQPKPILNLGSLILNPSGKSKAWACNRPKIGKLNKV